MSEESEQYGNERNQKGRFLPGNKAAAERGPNKISTKAKEIVVGLIEANLANFQEAFDKLTPKEQLDLLVALMPYAVPKLSSVQSDVKIDGFLQSPAIQIFNQSPPMASSEDKIDL